MGILDDAIREHLDLKRRHGARDTELREIEDDAFGGGERPDPFAAGELFAETAPPGQPKPDSGELAGPSTPAPAFPSEGGGEEPTRLVEPDAGAPPPPPEASAAPAEAPPFEPDFDPDAPSGGPLRPEPGVPEEPPAPEPSPPAPPMDLEEQPPAPPERPPESTDLPAESESLADLMAEEEAAAPPAPEPPAPEPDETAVRPAAELPELSSEAPPVAQPDPSDFHEPAIPEPPTAPPDAEPDFAEIEAEAEAEEEPSAEIELEAESDLEADAHSVPEPPPPPPVPGTEPPGRARGRVHHPTEEFQPPEPPSEELPPDSDEFEAQGPPSSGPLEPEGAPSSAAPEGEEAPGGPQLFDFETEEGDLAELPPAAPADSDDFEGLGPAEEQPYLDEDELDDEPVPEAEAEPLEASEDVFAPPAEEVAAPDEEAPLPRDPADPDVEVEDEDEDLLSESPEFTQEPEGDEDLWFEKGPPQEFDFEDE